MEIIRVECFAGVLAIQPEMSSEMRTQCRAAVVAKPLCNSIENLWIVRRNNCNEPLYDIAGNAQIAWRSGHSDPDQSATSSEM
jgi:hypothetical protein